MNKDPMLSLRRTAFTLIELLVVISIIGILAGMLMPAIGLVRESSRKANCGSNQRQIVLAMILYSTEYRAWPRSSAGAVADRGTTSQGVVLAKLRDDYKVYVCPSAAKPQAMKEALQGTAYTSWTLNMTAYASDWETPFNARPGRVVMADHQSGGLTVHKKTAIACYADGHVGNINKSSSAFPNADGADADIYSGTATDSEAWIR